MFENNRLYVSEARCLGRTFFEWVVSTADDVSCFLWCQCYELYTYLIFIDNYVRWSDKRLRALYSYCWIDHCFGVNEYLSTKECFPFSINLLRTSERQISLSSILHRSFISNQRIRLILIPDDSSKRYWLIYVHTYILRINLSKLPLKPLRISHRADTNIYTHSTAIHISMREWSTKHQPYLYSLRKSWCAVVHSSNWPIGYQ